MVTPVEAGVGRDGRWTVEELALARILEECLEALDEGETDVASLAARYPQAAAEIRPLLEIAVMLRERHLPLPVPAEFLRRFGDELLRESAKA